MHASTPIARLAVVGMMLAAAGLAFAANEDVEKGKENKADKATPPVAAAPSVPVQAVGRWNLTVGTGDHPQPSWLGVQREGSKYVGRFLGGAGSVGDIGEVKVEGATITFNAHGFVWTGTIADDTITGTRVHGQDKKNKGKWTAQRSVRKPNLTGKWCLKPWGVPLEHPAVLELTQQGDAVTGKISDHGKTVEITDVRLREGIALSFRAPFPDGERRYASMVIRGDVLDGLLMVGRRRHRVTGHRQRAWGEPIELFNGKDLNNWAPLGNAGNYHWKVVDGIMTNTGGGGSANIVSKEKFRDFRAHIEFRVPKGGNSGVYLRGRHEIQVSDSAGPPPNWHLCGALYSRIAPNVNAARKHGEWQTFDVTLIGAFLTVVHNGQVIIDNEEMKGITGGAIDSKESEPGPIYLQGDHGRIEYRKITIWPARGDTP